MRLDDDLPALGPEELRRAFDQTFAEGSPIRGRTAARFLNPASNVIRPNVS